MTLIAILIIIVHVLALGYWLLRWIGGGGASGGEVSRPRDLWGTACLLGALGLAGLGFETLILGHLPRIFGPAVGLNRATYYGSSIVMFVGLVAALPAFRVWLPAAFQEWRSAFRERPIITSACAAILLLVLVSTARQPFWPDEVQYQWAAPQFWANAGEWTKAPFHNTNGAAFAQILYTVGAVFDSSTAAHFTHSIFLLVLICGVASLSRLIGGKSIGAIAACLSCPVIVNQASVSYSDVMSAAFALSAYVALMCRPIFPPISPLRESVPGQDSSKESSPAWIARVPSIRQISVAAILFAAAVSVKVFLCMSMPAAGLYIGWRALSPRTPGPQRVRLVGRVALLGLPAIFMVIFWNVRATYYMHAPFLSEHTLVHSPTDPMWLDGEATGRVPSVRDILYLPVIPIYVTVMGQTEPYGGRTGLMLLLFVPVGIYFARKLPDEQRKTAWWILGSGAVYFFLLSPICVKTRYHIISWSMLACFVGIAFAALPRLLESQRRVFMGMFYIVMLAFMADSAHVLLKTKDGAGIFSPDGLHIAQPSVPASTVTHASLTH